MAINFHIKTKNTNLTPELTNYIHDKLGSIEKYITNGPDKEILAEVEVGLRTRRHKKGDIYRAEINLSVDGNRYRAVQKSEDMYAAIDEIRDEITKVVKRSGNKKEDLFRKGARQIKKLLRRGQ